MKTTILRCDRCKKETDELVEFSFINRNVQLNDLDKDEQNKSNPFSIFAMWGKTTEHPTIKGELCLGCIKEIGRWLGHSENILKIAEDKT